MAGLCASTARDTQPRRLWALRVEQTRGWDRKIGRGAAGRGYMRAGTGQSRERSWSLPPCVQPDGERAARLPPTSSVCKMPPSTPQAWEPEALDNADELLLEPWVTNELER